MITMLFVLITVHFLADYPLQGDFLGRFKCRKANGPVPWWHCLTAHASIHALGVGLVTGQWILGLIEFVLHWLIDFGKCENAYGINVDQGLHIICKLLYVIIITVLL